MSLPDVTPTVLHVVGGGPSQPTQLPPATGGVLTANSEADALAAIAEGGIDCVVVDTDATAVARRVRERHPTLSVVVRTDAGPVTVATGPAPDTDGFPDGTLERCVEAAVAVPGEPSSVLETLADGVYALDTDLRFVAVNGALVELTGYDRDDLLGEHVSLVVDEATVEDARDRLAGFERGDREDRRFEVELRRVDGERVPVEVGLSPVESAGAVTGVAGVVRDVTRRRERRRERELWEAMVDTVTDGLYALDVDRNILAASEGFARLAGRGLESLVGEHVSVCVEQSTIEDNVGERRAIMDGDQAYGEWEFDIVRPDGERVPIENRYTGLPTEEGLYGTAGVMRDIRGRRARARELELWRAMVDAVTDGLYVLDADRNVVAANEAFAEMAGYDVDSLVGRHISVCVDDSTIAETEAERRALIEGDATSDRHDFDIVRPDGERIPVEARYAALADSGRLDLSGTTGVVRDVTDRRRRERALADLHDWTRRMVRAGDADEVIEAAAGAVRALFEGPDAGVYALDDSGALALVDAGDAGDDSDLPAVLTEGSVWEAFVAEEPLAETGAADDAGRGREENSLGAGLVRPLGTHGVVVVGWGREEPVAGDRRELAAVLAANAETALDRATVEATLRDRERRLTARNDELARLDRTNGVIRGVHRALVSAGSREDGRAAVADWLSSADPYALAWFAGVTEVGGDVVVDPVVGGGDAGREYVDALRDRIDGSPLEALVAEAATTREVRTRPDVLEAADWRPFRPDALARGYRSVAAIPVTVSGRLEDVLVVHGTEPGTFPPADAEVLSELGGLIGRTLRAVDRAGVGSPDHRTAVEVDLPGPRVLLNRVATDLDAPVSLEGSVPFADGTVMSYVSAPVPGEALSEAIRARDSTSDVAVIAEDDDGALVGLRRTQSPLNTVVHDARGRLRSVTARGDSATATLDLPADVEVRSVVAAIDAVYPGATLRARRERISPDLPLTVRAALRERCTDRQYEALAGAYHSGYYEWPRLTTAGELADRAGVSSPTFQYHLRAGERKLLDIVVG
jgi:PAS domain S-box-containing protein